MAFLFTALMIAGYFALVAIRPRSRYRMWFRNNYGLGVLRIVGGGRLCVTGLEHIASGENYVVVSNHASLMDIPAAAGALPLDFKFLAKRELLKVPFIGWYLHRDGHPTLDRRSLRSSIESTNECARLIREKRLSVLIFPEGTRSPDGRLQRFHDGAAYLAIQAGVPLLPVAIVGTSKLLPARSSCFTPAALELRIGVPISVEGLTARDRSTLTASLEQAVAQLCGASDGIAS